MEGKKRLNLKKSIKTEKIRFFVVHLKVPAGGK
jgi:hypothetical protein